MSETTPLLLIEDVHVVYGGVIIALRGVSFAVPAGAIVALLGANGAGKTTTLKAVSSLIRAERGEVVHGDIRLRGESIRGVDAATLVRRGVVQVLEGRRCFPHLTVEENLLAGGFVRRPSRRALADGLGRVYAWFPRLKLRRHAPAGFTSGGEQQMIAIGRALMTEPMLVLLDEPSMGLAPMLAEEIFEIVRDLNRRERVTFLMAEQNLDFARRYADQAYVLETGRIMASGPAAELATRENITDIYLGAASEVTPDATVERRH